MFIRSRTRRDSTLRLYKYALYMFEKHLGDKSYPVTTVTNSDISSFCNHLANVYSSNSANIIYGIVKSWLLFCNRHGYLENNPCASIDEKRYFCKHRHHQAMTRKQFDACETSFWEDMEQHIEQQGKDDVSWLSMNIAPGLFSELCFVMGFYMQGLSFADLLMLKMSMIKIRMYEKGQCFIIETSRRKTGKAVKIVIPEEHSRRYRLFSMLYDEAERRNRQYFFSIIDDVAAEDSYIYNKVKKLNGTVNRCLKRWWTQLNGSVLQDCPIDIKNTSYYSCRHTFATLYIDSPDASLGELASLMGRNTEYIDTYIREITSENNLLNASSKVYGTTRNDGDSILQQMLDNQKRIISMLEHIVSHYCK